MIKSAAKRWLSFFRRLKATTYERRPRWRIALENLEDRLAPATLIWTGGGGSANPNWSNPANWSGGVPTGLRGGDNSFADLVFPVSASQRATTNDLAPAGGLATFKSISIAAGGYTLAGNAIALGEPSAPQNSSLIVGVGAQGNVISFDVLLNGPAASKHFFSVASSADVTISGQLSSVAGSSPDLSKQGFGTLILSQNNSPFEGAISIETSGGILNVRHALALGSSAAGTTVGTNATLQIENVVDGPIAEPLILNGPGVGNVGAILNISGANTWSGSIALDSNASFGSAAGTLTITGQISDLGAGHDLTKEGAGKVIFARDNTYRGLTTVNDGTLTIQHGLALGAAGTAQNGTIVNRSLTEVGTLQLDAEPPVDGIVVMDELLTINGPGVAGLGALANLRGDNNWAGDVILGSPLPSGSPASIGVAAGSSLIVSGVIDDPNGAFTLTKVDNGRLIFNNANTYNSITNVVQGALNIRDSRALGPGSTTVVVSSGAALELEVDFNAPAPTWPGDPHGRDLTNDSVTGTNGNGPQLGLTLTRDLNISGNGLSGTGALRSISGINRWTGTISLLTGTAAIGVDADPNASNTNDYFTHDYSLTVTGNVSGAQGTTFRKVRQGQLILPNANSYIGPTSIDAGWVTIRDNRSLGVPVGQVGNQILGDTVQPTTTVAPGASLHLKPLVAGNNLDILENLVLGGVGVVHPFSLIGQKGALVSLDGVNRIGGLIDNRSSDIRLNGIAGIGVETLGPGIVSELSITSSIADINSTTSGGITKLGSRRLNLQGDGTYSGAVDVAEGVLRVQHDAALGIASTGTASTGNQTYSQTTTTVDRGIAELQSLTVTGAVGTFTLTFNGQTTTPLSSSATVTEIEDALNALSTIGGVGGSVTVKQTANIYTVSFGGSLLGANQPDLIATPTAGLFVVSATIMNGDGASLELQSGIALNNGGLSGGIGIWYERLVLNSAGNTAFGDGALSVISDDALWRGPVTLQNDATITVMPSARITLFDNIDDALDPSASGSNLTIFGGGKVALTGNNSYRGTTFVNQGVLVLESGQALGGTGNAEVQTVTLSGSTSGTFTLTFNGQTTNPLPFAATALDVQSELNALSTIGGVGGSAAVTRVGNVFTITYGGKFFAFDQLALTAAGSAGAIAVAATTIDGAGATIVSDGAALELQGGITVGGESLLMVGQGAAQAANVPEEWFNVGPNPINSAQTAGNQAVTGRVTGVVTDFTDSNVIYISTAGGGVWKTKDGGKSWLPLFDLQNGSDEQQTVTVTAPGTFTLTFTDLAGLSATTVSLPTSATATEVQSALNRLVTIGGNDGSVVVTRTGNVFTITFQGNLAGANQPIMTASGPVNVATQAEGLSADDVIYIGAIAMDPTDPRILYIGTGEANNSTDSFYGTGVYRSTDSGKTWTRLDDATTGNPFAGKGIAKIIVDRGFNPNPATAATVFVASGDGGVSQSERQQVRINGLTAGVSTFTLTFTGPDSTGAVVSLQTAPIAFAGNTPLNPNANQTATNIQNALNALANIGGIGGNVTVTAVGGGFGGTRYIITFGGALAFLNVQQLTGNPPPPPGSPSMTITTINDGGNGRVVNGTTGNAGIWRFTGGNTWFNLTNVVSTNRRTVPTTQGLPPTDEAYALANPGPPPAPNTSGPNPPNSPGPDDDYRMYFPSTNATWSDVALIYTDISNTNNGSRSPVLYAALGTSTGDINNAVFFTGVIGTGNPLTGTTPIWYVGDPSGSPFDNPAETPDPGPPPTVDQRGGGFPRGQFAQWETDTNSFNPTASPFNGNIKIAAVAGATLATTTVFAVTAAPVRTLNNIYRTLDGGKTWNSLAAPPNNTIAQWDYANTILAVDSNNFFLGSYETNAGTHVQHLFQVSGAGIYQDISVDGLGNGPHTGDHALTRDAQGRLLVGTDGGVWRRETNGNWTNLNGNLGMAQINGVAGHPNDLKIAYAGTQSNGAQAFTNNLNWAYVDDKSAGQTFNSGGGQIRVDPKNPNIVYYVELRTGGNAIVRCSLAAGAAGSWTTLAVNTFRAVAPLVLDSILSTRLLVGGNSLQESFNQGNSWTNIGPIALPFVSEIGIATYQGAFAADPNFTQNADNGNNTYDPDTIYATDGISVYLTKNHGVTWVDRTNDLTGLGFIADLEVDPANRDTIYAVRNVTNGGVYKSTDAGRNWTEVTYDLPNYPVWKIVLDPRTGDLYAGTDAGVYRLLAGTTHWRQFGNGLANTQVRDLELNQGMNSLLAGTYGRGVYQLFLDDSAANAGALRAVSGTSVWTGPVYLAGDTTVSANGTQTLQNGIATASLTIVGSIQDAPGVAPPGRLTKIGQGNVILAGANTYAGVTDIVEGVLIVQNPRALGASAAVSNTIVNTDTALELQSDLELEPITVNGDGILFNNHFQGALRNSSNFNTYTGPLTLATNSTIGVDSGSQLTIGSKAGLAGVGVIDDLGANFTLTKELTGTLALGGANTYGGTTFVNQGALQVEHALALGDGNGPINVNGTLVRDGAQLQMHTPTTGAFAGVSVVVTTESLSLSGTGIFGTGALYNTGGNNTWSSPILLDIQPGLAPDTAPPGVVAFGVSTAGDTLTVSPAAGLTQTAATGINKVGPGTLVLSTANNHTGTTYVNNGILNIQDSGALGAVAPFNEIQRVTVIGPIVGAGTFNLTFNGQTTGQLGFGTSSANVDNALTNLSTIGGIGGSVDVLQTGPIDTPSGTRLWIYTVTFTGTMSGVNQNLMSGAGSTASTDVIVTTVADGSIGTRVAAGAALQVQGNGLVVAEALALNGAGVGGAGALRNLAGDNTWTSDVFFQTSSAIGADPGTQLTVSGQVQDPYVVPVPAGSLTKVGQGTVVFPGANTYSGRTIINDGILNIRHAGGLGRHTETQTITLGGSATGTFQLSFNGFSTAFLPFNSPATGAGSVQDALNGLASIGGAGGSVSVVRHGNVFTVTFGGSLSVIGSQPLMTAASAGGTTAVIGSVWEVQTVTILGPNGTFALRFNGQQTAALPLTASAASLQAELELLPNIGSGNVLVTKTANVFTIVFAGPLAQANQNQMTSVVTGGATALVNTLTDGPEGTLVNNGATLQVQGNIIVSSEDLTINGLGFGWGGALANTTGTNVWSRQITLGSDSSLGATVGNAAYPPGGFPPVPHLLYIDTAIVDGPGNVFALTKVGPGLVSLFGFSPNTYDGLTKVSQGVLLFDKAPGVAAFGGDLQIGDSSSDPDFSAVAVAAHDEAIPDTAVTTILKDGLLDLYSQVVTETIDQIVNNDGHINVGDGALLVTSLTINDGNVDTDAGSVTVSDLGMTGGTITLGAVAGALILDGDIAATSSALASSVIQGAGFVDFGGVDRSFTVDDGPGAIDLRVDCLVDNSGGEMLDKLGTGVLQLDAAGVVAGTTTVHAGLLQVDGNTADIVLDGGTLGGVGTVTNILTATGGIAAPGDSPGILHASGDVAWDGNVTYFVELDDVNNDDIFVPGFDFDVLDVAGTIDLGLAHLDGNLGAVAVGDTFRIITADTVVGQFSQGLFAFIDGKKFDVVYHLDAGGPDWVEITRIKNAATVSIVSSVNPSDYGQDVTFFATVTPEANTGPIPDGTPVEFTVTGPSIGAPIVFTTGLVNSQAAFNPFSDASFILDVAPFGSEYNLNVRFLETSDFYEANELLLQQVNKADTEIHVTSAPNPSFFGETVTITADVDVLAPGGALPGSNNLSGVAKVVFFIDNVPQAPVDANASGIATITLSTLTVGGHLIRASYLGDSHFNSSNTTSDYTQQVNKAITTTSVSAAPNPVDPGAPVTFNVHVGSALGVPSGTVVILDGTEVQRVTVAGGAGTFTLKFGANTTPAMPFDDTAANVETRLNALPSIGGVGGSVSVTKNGNVFTVTFLGELSGLDVSQLIGAGSGGATVSVTTQSNGGAAFDSTGIDGSGNAVFTISTLPPGSHVISVNYLGSTNYASSNGSTPLVVRGFTTITVTPSPSPSTVGQNVTFTVAVAPVAPATATPSGTVSFYDGPISGANFLGSATLANGAGTFDISSLAFGTHTINLAYSGDGNFVANNSASASHTVKGNTTTSVVAAPNPSALGETVTITATVTANAPASGTPTGDVRFLDGTTLLAVRTLAGGVASFNVSNLTVAVHTLNVEYLGAALYNISAGSATQTVKANTATSIVSTLNPSTFGQTVTFNVTVSPVAPVTTTPTGTVDIFDGGNLIADDLALDAAGKAALSTALLNAGTHTITAVYNGATLYNSSNGTLNPSQVVNPASTSIALTSPSANPTVYGQPVTLVATVATLAPGAGTPNGTVDFFDGAALIGDDIPLNGGGVASYAYAGFTVGLHPNVTARFNGVANFQASTSNSLSRSINKASTQTALASTVNPSVYGQTTITATVTAVVPGGGVPDGTVTFFITNLANNQLSQVSTAVNASGVATLSPALNVGSFSISARYNGSASYILSNSNTINPQTVNKANTATSLATSGSPLPFGGATITAAVAAVAPGAGAPTGQVVFHVTGGPSAGDYTANLNSSAVATLPIALSVGAYAITADYLGDSNFNVSNGALAGGQTVIAANSSVAVASSSNPSVFGQSVTFTATVSAVAPGAGVPNGSVDFVIDGITLGDDVPLSGGVATFSTATLSISGSPHSVVVNYNSSLNFNASATSLSGGQVVNKANVNGTLAANAPALVGTTVAFNATIVAAAPGAGTPGGTADLFVDGTEIISNQPVSGGAVAFNTSHPILTQGNHSVYVHYDGDANFNSGNSNTITQSIQGDVAVGVTSNHNPSVYGELVAFTATVSAVVPAVGVPSGTIDFIIDGVTVASNVPLSSGQATFQTALINVSGSPHVVSAHYDGDQFFFTGNGALPGGQSVTKAATVVAVAATPNASIYGQQVAITATVSRQTAGAGLPSGTVDFFIDGVEVQSNVALLNGQAIFQTANIPVSGSPHSIQVHYDESDNFSPSDGALAGGQTVVVANTTTSVTSSVNPSVIQQNVTFTATVVSQASGSLLTPTGTVDFIIDGAAVADNVALAADGTATFSTDSLAIGTHTVQVHFDGNSNVNASDGTLPGGQVIRQNPIVFAIVPGSVKSGTPFTVVVHYRNADGTAPEASFNGPVTLAVASGPAGGGIAGTTTVNAVNGVATFTNIVAYKAGAYILSASANSLPIVFAPVMNVTALGLAVAVSPAPKKLFTGKFFTVSVTAFDATGGVATNYNGLFSISVVKKPAGAKITGPFAGVFNGGFGQLARKVNKAGRYIFRVNGPDGLTATFTITIRGRRSS